MTEGSPPTPADGRPGGAVRPDDIDEERLGQAMAALLGGGWPGADEKGAASGFTLPPPRHFETVDHAVPPLVGEPAPPDGPVVAGGAEAEVEPEAEPEPAASDAWASDPWASIDEPAASDAWAPIDEPAASDPWASIDEPTQAHSVTWDDEAPQESEPALVEPLAYSDAVSPPDDWWGADDPVEPVASGPEPGDQAALEHAGLAGPMNTALSDLRRVGGADADATSPALGVPPGAYVGSGKLAELRYWWSGRGRELLPGLAVAAVVVFAFAVVLLGRDPDSDGSKVNTGAVPTVTVTTSPPLPEDPVASEPLFGETFGDPLFSDPLPDAGSGSPAVNKPSPSPTTRRPARAPAAGSNPSRPGPQPGPGPTTAPTTPPNPVTTQPPVATTAPPPTDPPNESPSQRCARLPELC